MMHNDDELMDPFSDDEIVGDDAQLQASSGDELDFADTVNRLNPTSDQLQHFANMRGIKHAMLNGQAPFMRNNPPSILKGSLGNQSAFEITLNNATYKGSVATGSSTAFSPLVQVANWLGDDAETLPITVTVAPVQQIASSSPNVPAWPYAVVQFGTRGSLAQFEVDIATGLQFTLNASAITLKLGLETFDIRQVVVPPGNTVLASEVLTGMLSFHTTTHALPVTRTRYIQFTQPAASAAPAIIPVPAFSRNLVMVFSTVVAVSFTVAFRDSVGTTMYTKIIAAGTTWGDPVPLSGDITTISVLRTDAIAAETPARLIFGLAF